MGFDGTATHYFNAQHVLPPDLVEHVLAHLPPDRRDHVLLYFQTDHYAARNAAIKRAFEAAVTDGHHATLHAVYEAIAAEFCLSPRRVWGIVRTQRDGQVTRAERGVRPRRHRGRRVRRTGVGRRRGRRPERRTRR